MAQIQMPDHILLSACQADFDEQIRNLQRKMIEGARFGIETDEYGAVLEIVREVMKGGDRALLEFTSRFDGVDLSASGIRVGAEELEAAWAGIDGELMGSLRKAIDNVRRYQSEIFLGNRNSHPGIRYTPIRRVGVCVPGASAPLPSTVIMTAVPAQVAGVEEIAVISPPRCQGTIHPVILAVCCELGIREVYRVGGAQAVAALAYGTETIGKVDKIVGPGNRWVQTAKKIVVGCVGIDSVAGPSEVLIIADDRANPAWVAADMLSQAEHAPGSAIVATDSAVFAQKVLANVKEQVGQLKRSEATVGCLLEFSKIVVFENLDRAVEFADDFAAEHLQIQCGDASRAVAEKIHNAGAIFIGPYSPVAVGDYWAGPSHTLPTGTSAKFFSALSSNDFVKATSIIEYDKEKLADGAADIVRLAMTEGLDAHARSVQIRQQD